MTIFKKGIFNAIGLFILFAIFSQTACQGQKGDTLVNNGKILDSLKNQNARDSLKKVCHFITKSQIESYIKRFEAWKQKPENVQLTIPQIFPKTTTFNKDIVQAILNIDKCVGLRVAYGMDEQYRFRVILVGVGEDYSTLYLKRKDAKCFGDSALGYIPPKLPNRSTSDSSAALKKPVPLPKQVPGKDTAAATVTMSAQMKNAGEEEGGAEMGQVP